MTYPSKLATKSVDLTSRRWQIQGWRPFCWLLRQSIETFDSLAPEYDPLSAVVPGSAHTALRQAGVIPDWNLGRSSIVCEWVEHRHWEFFTDFSAGELPADVPLILHADGLDYSGWVIIDTTIVTTFRGALIRHRFDLTSFLGDGCAHRLSLIFDAPPEEQGQVGKTSLSKFFKPRYNYSWDWCVRLVPVGIFDRLTLVCNPSPVEVIGVTVNTSLDLAVGEITARIQNCQGSPALVKVVLRSEDGKIALEQAAEISGAEGTMRATLSRPALWWPNGQGAQSLYHLEISDGTMGVVLFDSVVGFKHIKWLPCEGAPAHARDMICEINGRPIFLQGVNWTPVDLDYPATSEADYRRLIRLYQEMGCNLLRVWGGGFLEREIFYRLCDEVGLLVWQEFPMSSSGVDNEAPRDPVVIAELEIIATDYIRRRSHHASLLLWCGGNELQSCPEISGGPSAPLTEAHPALDALERVVQREQPGIRFLPTSPSGPVFFAHRAEMGKGIHHHVHGPWDKNSPEADWQDYWSHDDSLLRSETGVTGVSSVNLLERYAGEESIWPPNSDNPWWRHSASWWYQWDMFKAEFKSDETPAACIARFVSLSQARQARFLAIAARNCKQRFPKCAGFIVWMGHDAFPCPTNTSIIDFDRQPKPAYMALREVFRAGQLKDLEPLKPLKTT